MKSFRIIPVSLGFLVAAFLLVGCGHKEGADHSPSQQKFESKEKDHNQEEESPSGASFKAGTGVTLTEETRKSLGLEVADVEEEKLHGQIHFTAQVYGKAGTGTARAGNEITNAVRASGFITPAQAAMLQTGTPVQLVSKSGAKVDGTVVKVHKALALGDAEVDLTLPEGTPFKEGEFLTATITLPREEPVIVIPKSALLRTSEGTFVYAVNGNAFIRTAVKVGSESDGKIEIIDGLFTGDQVVTKPVETLWLIELRATKGGGGCH